MNACRGKRNVIVAAGLFLSVLMLGACTSIKYSYDSRTPFTGLKTYAWGPSSVIYGSQDPLLEANVQILADRLLGQKGYTRVAQNPDLFISTQYEPEISYPENGYRIRMLTLNMYTAPRRELVWRGSASGRIHTDAASGDLKDVVQRILSHFPPKAGE